MSRGNLIGVLGTAILILGIAIMLHPTANTSVVTFGASMQTFAYVIILVAALRRPLKWLLMLLFAPISAYLWLLSLGH